MGQVSGQLSGQSSGQLAGQVRERAGLGRPGRAEAVAETLAALRGTGERPEELAHDARNMVAALELYCELLDEPGVLTPRFRHYGSELRLVAAASRRLVDKLAAFELPEGLRPAWLLAAAGEAKAESSARNRSDAIRRAETLPETPIQDTPIPDSPIKDLAAELGARRNLLAALAGPGLELELSIRGGAHPVWLTREDLTRALVNLVKNAVEAVGVSGRIAIGLDEFHAPAGAPWLVLTVEDSGPGIDATALEGIFTAGFTTHTERGCGLRARRGLGLSITRSIVEGAGGRIFAANRHVGGARFDIELPVRRP